VISAAKSGDMQAARLILDRIAPPRKGRPVALELPSVETAEDVVKALGVVVAETASGTITPEEAVVVAGVLEAKRKAIETVDIERRLAALEGEAKRQ
jgi:ethanolamine utilization microcompartment shell protein EutS